MAFNIPGLPFRPNGSDVGAFDLGSAIKGGLQNYGLAEEARYKPKTLAENLLRSQLENKINQAKADVAPEMVRADIDYKNALARVAGVGGLSTFDKAWNSYQHALNNSGEDSLQTRLAKQNLERLSQGSNGITIRKDPDTGEELIQIGGSSSNKGQGGGLLQSASGQIYSSGTPASQTNLQQRIIGEQAIKPYINKVIETLPEFQSLPTKIKSGLQGVSNYALGTNYSLPSKEAAGKAAVVEASEGMMKAFGLNATGANRRAMESILTPHFGESVAGYRNRVIDQATQYALNATKAKQSLRQGINVSQENNNSDETRILNTAKKFNTTPEIVKSALDAGVKTADEFRDWIKGLQ